MAEFLTAIEQNVVSRHLFRPGERILVAVSGGLDSMVLLQVLHQLAAKYRWSLRVAHLNHRLRGQSSNADERLVRRTCKSLRLPVTVRRLDVAGYACRKELSIEMAAREVRHAFLAQTAVQRDCSGVALAHHADDQVELFFLRLLRGSGSEGLRGMRWRGPSSADPAVTLVRPLLDQPKSALASYARLIHLRYREDASNAKTEFLRNRIRIELLPVLRRRYQPALTRTILRVMDILGAEADFLSQTAREWDFHEAGRPFSELPVAVQRRLLQRQLADACVPADFELVESLRCHPGQPVTVEAGRIAVCGADGLVRVQLTHTKATGFKSGCMTLDILGETGRVSFAGARISWMVKPIRRFVQPRHQPGMEAFDADRLGPRILLRHWRPGDRFQPIGMGCQVKLQDLFTNEKVLRNRRHELILGVTEQDEVFWVEGLRISERFKLTKAAKRRLLWQWERP